jgi:uncharacterized protein (DUF427 family)
MTTLLSPPAYAGTGKGDPSLQNRPVRIEPGPGQESVWDYPRPPRVEPCRRRVRAVLGGVVVADSSRALRVLETASPPTIYVPRADVREECLVPAAGGSWCEWKGRAAYFDVVSGEQLAEQAAWTYHNPTPPFGQLAGHVAFYPGRMDACYLDEELVRPQPGGFYGGWITDDIVGPVKGDPGTLFW